jgi:hypothetical protein
MNQVTEHSTEQDLPRIERLRTTLQSLSAGFSASRGFYAYWKPFGSESGFTEGHATYRSMVQAVRERLGIHGEARVHAIDLVSEAQSRGWKRRPDAYDVLDPSFPFLPYNMTDEMLEGDPPTWEFIEANFTPLQIADMFEPADRVKTTIFVGDPLYPLSEEDRKKAMRESYVKAVEAARAFLERHPDFEEEDALAFGKEMAQKGMELVRAQSYVVPSLYDKVKEGWESIIHTQNQRIYYGTSH